MPEEFNKEELTALLNDIVDVVGSKRSVIKDIISDIRTKVTDLDSLVLLAPIIKDFLEASIRNDGELTKVATIIQRGLNATAKPGAGGLDDMLSDAEKEFLLSQAKQNKDEEMKKLRQEAKEAFKKVLD